MLEGMVVPGLPTPRSDHLKSLVEMAIEMQAAMGVFRNNGLCDFDLRIGINKGPAMAGIIGYKKFSHDLWGDTVNVASRMESFGIPGKIQVTKKCINGTWIVVKMEFGIQSLI